MPSIFIQNDGYLDTRVVPLKFIKHEMNSNLTRFCWHAEIEGYTMQGLRNNSKIWENDRPCQIYDKYSAGYLEQSAAVIVP